MAHTATKTGKRNRRCAIEPRLNLSTALSFKTKEPTSRELKIPQMMTNSRRSNRKNLFWRGKTTRKEGIRNTRYSKGFF